MRYKLLKQLDKYPKSYHGHGVKDLDDSAKKALHQGCDKVSLPENYGHLTIKF